MWSGILHDPEFVGKMIDHVESGDAEYKTKARILGMCTIAQAVRGLFCIVIVTFLTTDAYRNYLILSILPNRK